MGAVAPLSEHLFVRSFPPPSVRNRVTLYVLIHLRFLGPPLIDVVETLSERKVVWFAVFSIVVEQELPDVGAIGSEIIVSEYRKAFALACEPGTKLRPQISAVRL